MKKEVFAPLNITNKVKKGYKAIITESVIIKEKRNTVCSSKKKKKLKSPVVMRQQISIKIKPNNSHVTKRSFCTNPSSFIELRKRNLLKNGQKIRCLYEKKNNRPKIVFRAAPSTRSRLKSLNRRSRKFLKHIQKVICPDDRVKSHKKKNQKRRAILKKNRPRIALRANPRNFAKIKLSANNKKKHAFFKNSKMRRLFWQENQLLNNNVMQFTKKLALPFRPKWWENKKISLKIWKPYKKSYIFDFWLKYKSSTEVEDFNRFIKRYRKFKIYNTQKKILKSPNPAYEAFKRIKLKSKYWRLGRKVKKKYPWLESILYKPKLYKLTKQRSINRLKGPWSQRKFYYSRWWLKLSKNKKGVAKKVETKKDLLYRKYIFLPFLTNYKSTQFKRRIQKLRTTQKLTEGNYMQGNFENRLEACSYNLNYAPHIYWSRYFTDSGLIAISNPVKPVLFKANQIAFFDEPKLPEVKLIKTTHAHYALLSKWINKKLRTTTKVGLNSIKNFYDAENIQLDGLQTYNKTYRVNFGEIVHVSPFFAKNQLTYFRSTLLKRIEPNHFQLNKEKNISFMYRFLKRTDIQKKHRVSQKQWQNMALHTRK